MSEAQPARSELTVLDWIGFGVAALAEVFNVVFAFVIAPTFAKMFEDMGGPLPPLTQLVMTRWFAPALATVAFLPLALSLDGSRPIGVRRALVLGGTVLAIGTAVLLLLSMYIPVFALAGSIK